MELHEFRRVLSEVVREELGISDVQIAERFRGGELVLVPGRSETQEKRIPVDMFFKKIILLRDKLRVLEQKVNTSKLEEKEKIQLQQYITACYGTLTTFNILFEDKDDKFVGAKREE